MASYSVFDVFTSNAFTGNPLAIVFEADRIAEAQLQDIAKEFGYSECVFVFPPKSAEFSASLRIFTPTQEIPFAGHPLIGTSVALAQLGYGQTLSLGLKVGTIRSQSDGQTASIETDTAFSALAHPDPALVAKALGLTVQAISTQTHAPVLGTVGLPFTLVELTDRSHLSAIDLDLSAIKDGVQQHPDSLDFALFPYVRDGEDVNARMFAPLDNIPEDPATGSASAALCALLASLTNAPATLKIRQGDDMGRPSEITVHSTGTTTKLSGAAVKVMQGDLLLP